MCSGGKSRHWDTCGGRGEGREQFSSSGAVPPHLLSSYSVMELLDSECHGSEYLSAGEGSRDDFWTGMCVGMCAVGSCSHGHLLLWLRLSLQGRKQFLPTSRHCGGHCWGNVILGKASGWREVHSLLSDIQTPSPGLSGALPSTQCTSLPRHHCCIPTLQGLARLHIHCLRVLLQALGGQDQDTEDLL